MGRRHNPTHNHSSARSLFQGMCIGLVIIAVVSSFHSGKTSSAAESLDPSIAFTKAQETSPTPNLTLPESVLTPTPTDRDQRILGTIITDLLTQSPTPSLPPTVEPTPTITPTPLLSPTTMPSKTPVPTYTSTPTPQPTITIVPLPSIIEVTLIPEPSIIPYPCDCPCPPCSWDDKKNLKRPCVCPMAGEHQKDVIRCLDTTVVYPCAAL